MVKFGPGMWFRQWLNAIRPAGSAKPDLEAATVPKPDGSLRVEAALLSDVGRVRKTNEDRVRFVGPGNEPGSRAMGCIALVADGVGGQEGGEVASELAVQLIPQSYYAQSQEPAQALRMAMETANRAIHERGVEDGKNMATTCTALVISAGQAWCGHVGDSRLYLVRGGELYVMTEDHSLVMEWLRQGILNRDEARRHPSRNVITRSLGNRSEVDVSLWSYPFPVMDRDLFVLCTDGLYDYLEDGEFIQCAASADLAASCRRLIDRANARGGDDNLSVVLLRVSRVPPTRVQ